MKKIFIVGVGGIGGYFGARLIEHGFNITFIATTRTSMVLKEKGLKINSVNGDLHLKDIQVTDKFNEVADLIIICVKSPQLGDVAEAMRPSIGKNTIILPLLNGIDATSILSEIYGKKVVGGFCKLLSFKIEPGFIKHIGYGVIDLGELDGPVTKRVENIKKIFIKANIEVSIHDDFVTAQWEKMIFISTTSAIGAVTRAPFGVYRKINETRELLKQSIRECVDVSKIYGAKFDKLFPDNLLKLIDALPEEGTTSMQRDIMEGRPSELHYLIGYIVKNSGNIEIPVTRQLYYSLLPLDQMANQN